MVEMSPNDATRHSFHVQKTPQKNISHRNTQNLVFLQVLYKVSLTFSNCFLHDILSFGHVIIAGPEQHPDGRGRVFTRSRATHVTEELYLFIQESQDLIILPLKHG